MLPLLTLEDSFMIETNDFKKGVTIKLDKDPYVIVDFQHVKPGKGNAFTRTRLKNILTKAVLEKTFKSGDVFESADVTLEDYDFLYEADGIYHFMNRSSYEQLELPQSVLEDQAKFLKENMRVKIQFYEGRPFSVELPNFVELEVTYCEPGVKGDSATSKTKPATLETGAQVQVPLHIKLHDVLKIDTRTGDYVEKVK